jgi:hypothetical protein
LVAGTARRLAVVLTVFDAPLRAAGTRSAIASPTCKMGARRGAAHSRGWQEYGTYGPATNMPHEVARFSPAQTYPLPRRGTRLGRRCGPA